MTAPRRRGVFPPLRVTGDAFTPDFYSTAYPNTNVLSPDDLATIYNVNALYKADVDGTGQLIAVAGATDIDMTDIQYFRKAFGLPPNNPMKILVPGSNNPGIDSNELGEADLDLEWSGAIAPNATIVYVYSDDVVNSAFFAIDEALAPVLSFSYGGCELGSSQSDAKTLAAEARRAAAEGITWVVSSGDSGAAGCESQGAPYTAAASPMSANLPASVPYVTAVGGAEFNEGKGNYSASKPRSNGGSALSYIPEGAWTDEALIPQYGDTGFAASGGGASIFYAKPSWQKGPGVPKDGARDVPDVVVTASWYHDPYALITGGMFVPNGGTSAAAPTFAGMVALINQYDGGGGLGNINPSLYALAQSAPAAFHDITTGSNIVPCVIQSSADCKNGFMGYRAGPGYDQVTGLGSVDAYRLAQSWNASAQSPHLVVTQLTASTTAKVGGAINVTLVVANEGNADAGAFEMRVYLTTDGTIATANNWYIYCSEPGLTAGKAWNCNGTVTLGQSVTPGTYYLLGVADAKSSVQEADPSGGTAPASSGPLVVSK